MELSSALALEFATSYLSIGVVAALAVTAVAALARTLWLHARLKRRTQELEAELAQRQRAEAELQTVRDHLESRVRERTHALEARNEELSRLRLALEAANRRLKRMVALDPLTAIANRRHFDRALDREVRRVRREQLPLSLIFLDLDEFKQFNDTHGHAAGDEVLRRVARTLDETFRRGGDLVARYGGEEFAVILPAVDARRAGLYAERLRRRIWRMAISVGAAESNKRITISGGVATIVPGSPGFMNATPDVLLRTADQALYRAKCLGRNRIAMAANPPPADRERPAIELAS
ncbi:diguanylate cyclase [Steroidobacter sp. S1-65]|uniref:diguanylate cyclase n=1 Tax=Steroidobacter gossypii TaxID=2805490 RepID=A0ABS1WU41_9GAMM|nr:diguanylate cyclase [Steroidobacter gossypii]MBM0104482.1 diguanylate cyclase [Steroidobacter gossypii]